MYYFKAAVVVSLLVKSVTSIAWLTTPVQSHRRAPASNGFVSLQNGHFQLNGRPFFYFATNVYYLMHLTDQNIKTTLQDVAKHNITVVRTWGFNDVLDVPPNGTWLQAIKPNGTIINQGVNGLQRLDTIVKTAEQLGLKIHFVLTNNWNPRVTTTSPLTKRQADPAAAGKPPSKNVTHPHGFLSNDYGGMDAYVLGHGQSKHDVFYTNQTIINAFINFLEVFIPRYKNSTSVLGWEIANDPRCNSSLPQSGTCTTQTITRWHAEIAQVIRRLDPNHVCSSGTGGYLCLDCPKLYPLPPRPQASPVPGGPKVKKRVARPLTKNRLLADRQARAKRNAEAARNKRGGSEIAKRSYRGQLRAVTHTARQSQQVGAAFDGKYGVDAQDILNIPDIGFGGFQLFPDQNIYGPPDPNLDAVQNVIENGVEWITTQAESAASVGKPIALNGFGLVTTQNLPEFVPFNDTQAIKNADISPAQTVSPASTLIGVEQGQRAMNDTEQLEIYEQWIQAAITADLDGITHWQWSLDNLQQAPQPAPSTVQQTTFVPSLQQQVTPNDGYASVSQGLKDVLQQGALEQAVKNI